MTVEETIRAEHPDWTDDQVTAEVAKRSTDDPPPDPKDQGKGDQAMAAMRRRAEAAEKRERDAKAELERIEREKAEKAGEWEKLAKQYETERDEARKELADLKQQIKVEGIAGSLKFKHVDEALALLPKDLNREDDTAVSKALGDLAEARPHLIEDGTPGPTGRPPTGGQKAELTKADIERMTPAEINSRWDEVQQVISQ